MSVLVPAHVVMADDVSGTWTGALALRGNYYWEQSTRVVAPAVYLDMASPEGVNVHADYLVDAITSASQAAGTLVDVRFTEVRHDFSLGFDHEVQVGDVPWQVGATMHLSREPDYLSFALNTSGAFALHQRTTTLRYALTFLHDEVRQNFRGATNTPAPGSADVFEEAFDGVVLGLGWDQILRPNLTLHVSYDLGRLRGYLANPYRRVAVNDTATPEMHPEKRLRHTVTATLAYYLRATHTTFHVGVRGYADSWKIHALTPELRIYQELSDTTTLRLRWRYYQQTRAFFYERDPSQYTENSRYITADPKMSRFHSHLFGMQMRLKLGFLESTAFDALRDAELDFSFEYLFSTSSFGNAVIGQAGIRVPF